MGRNLPSPFTWGVDCARPNEDTCSSGQHSWTPLPVPAFLSVVPTTQYWSGCGGGPGSLHSGVMFLCVTEPWTPSRMSMLLGEEKWGAPPSLRGDTFTHVAT